MVPTPDFWLRLKVDFFRSKWFIADLLQNSQPRARLLRWLRDRGSIGHLGTWMGEQSPQPPAVQSWVGSARIPFRMSLLSGSCCGRQWLWSLSAAQRDLPNSQHCSLHWAAGNRALFIALTYTPCWWWHLMSSALQKFCVVCNAHGFLWEEIFDYFPLPMNWGIPTLQSIITPLVRAVHSWQGLPRQDTFCWL